MAVVLAAVLALVGTWGGPAGSGGGGSNGSGGGGGNCSSGSQKASFSRLNPETYAWNGEIERNGKKRTVNSGTFGYGLIPKFHRAVACLSLA